MTAQTRSLAQLAGAVALMAATYTFTLTTPAHTFLSSSETAAGLMVLVGALLAPGVLITAAARNSYR